MTSDLRGLVLGRKDTSSGWLGGTHGGGANSGERRGTVLDPCREPGLLWKERLTSLPLQLSKYFCFPFAGWRQPLPLPALRAFRAVALSCGLEVSSATLTRWDQTEDCGARGRGRC